MKKLLLFQPLIIFIIIVSLLCQYLSPWIGIAALIIGIVIAISLAYFLRGRHIKKLRQTIQSLDLSINDIVPIRSGLLGMDALIIDGKSLHRVSAKSEVWRIRYKDIATVTVDVFAMEYTLTRRDSTSVSFAIHPLKNRGEVFAGLKDPQVAIGAAGVVGAPLVSLTSAQALSAGSARQRVEALNARLQNVMPGDVSFNLSYDGAFKMSDIILGVLAALEVVGLIVMAAILFHPLT